MIFEINFHIYYEAQKDYKNAYENAKKAFEIDGSDYFKERMAFLLRLEKSKRDWNVDDAEKTLMTADFCPLFLQP